MNTTATIANRDGPIRKYELGRPIIRREQRIAFERIHRAVAQTWSDSMAEYLPTDAALEFEALDFDAFSSVSMDTSPCAQIALFSIASTPISGFLMMTGALAKFLVSSRLGLKSATDDQANQAFTRIEAAIARETTRTMLVRLGDAYATAGLGSIGNIRECDDLADSFLFTPDEYLALLKFRISAPGEELRLLIGLSGNAVGAMSEDHPATVAKSNRRNAIVNVVRQLPIEVDVVLGSWKVPLCELLQLRAGEKIVLPDGEDAWLAARGVRIRRASVEISGNCASIEIRKSVRMR
jgi:flagellar motor switch protein FliM